MRLGVALFYRALADLYTLRPRADRCARVGHWHDGTITGVGQMLKSCASRTLLWLPSLDTRRGAVTKTIQTAQDPGNRRGLRAGYNRSIIDEIVTTEISPHSILRVNSLDLREVSTTFSPAPRCGCILR
jgi:hypothetical protein